MILTEYVKFAGELVCVSGLRVGGSGGELAIGAMDNPLIRDPFTYLPYIPGSTLKGKMRSGLEAQKQNLSARKQPTDDPCGCGSCMVCRIFGPFQNSRSEVGPTRLLVRDLHLTDDSRLLYEQSAREGRAAVEEKTENMINRATGTATNPRTSERVVPGLAFDLRLVLRVFDGDPRQEMIDHVRRSLGTVETEYLGSSGSRGYGEVEVRALKMSSVPARDVTVSIADDSGA